MILYILAAILIFGVLIAVHEFGHFLTAKLCGVRVNEFSIGMGPQIWGRTVGETEYSLRLLPIGGFCAMEGEDSTSDDERSLTRQGFWKQALIFAAGSIMNFLTGLLIVLILYSGTAAFYTTQVLDFAPEFPAQGDGGLQPGDQLWTINGERVYLYSDVSLLLSLDGDGLVDMEVRRDGEVVDLGQIPLAYGTYSDENGEPYQGLGWTIGVEKATLGAKLRTSWLNTIDFVRIVRLSLQMFFTGEAGMEDLSGPVGIVSAITQVGSESPTLRDAVENILYFAAMIAVNLAVMNLLPIPALDGGKIFFLIVDTLAFRLLRKKIPEKYEMAVNTAGFVVLMGFMAVVTFQDVFKLIR